MTPRAVSNGTPGGNTHRRTGETPPPPPPLPPPKRKTRISRRRRRCSRCRRLPAEAARYGRART